MRKILKKILQTSPYDGFIYLKQVFKKKKRMSNKRIQYYLNNTKQAKLQIG